MAADWPGPEEREITALSVLYTHIRTHTQSKTDMGKEPLNRPKQN